MARPYGKKYTKERMNKLNEMIKRRKDEGFTLIELMIVIAVIGILAVVLVPKMGQVKTAAKLAGVETNFRSVTNVLQGGNFTVDTDVNALLTKTFMTTPNNQLVNPITKAANISTTGINGAIIVVAANTPAPTTASNVYYKGAVIVKPDLTIVPGRISVYGCDEKGALIPGITMVITP